MFQFAHLVKINQSYVCHLIDAMKYSLVSQKASYYFFIHALYPDAYLKDGSQTIGSLHHEISSKYSNNVDSFRRDIRK
jgi:hypothetical protein